MNRILFRRVEEIRDTLIKAREAVTDAEALIALTTGIHELNAFLRDLKGDEPEEKDEEPKATAAAAQRTLADELWQFGCALQYAHMAVWE